MKTSWRITGIFIAVELGLGVLGLIWMHFSSISSPNWLLPRYNTWIHALIGTGLAAIIAALMILMARLVPALSRLIPRQAVKLLKGMTSTQAILLALSAGIGEEILFRGALQPSFGLLVASFLFAIAHPVSLLYVIMVFLMGLLLGWIYTLFGSLYVPIFLHAAYDYFMIELLRRTSILQPAKPVQKRELIFPEEFPAD